MTYTRQCDVYQRVGKPTNSSTMPLTPILALAPFEKWGIDFVGPINPPSRHDIYQYILVATNYVTKWAEVGATRKGGKYVVVKFLREKSYFAMVVQRNW